MTNTVVAKFASCPLLYPRIPADRRILFFQRDRRDYGFLSNFHHAPIRIDGVDYAGVEWFYQAAKSLDQNYREEIRASISPGKTKRLGDSRLESPQIAKQSRFRKRPELLRPDWNEIRVPVMKAAIDAKFRQNPWLMAMLLATEPAVLVEDSQHDRFWGAGSDGEGMNLLGKILMDVRAKLSAEYKGRQP